MISTAGHTLRSVQALLSESVDYAGLFPPSQVSMETAVKNYASYRAGADSWMLGRFVCPVGSLDEFERTVKEIDPEPAAHWKISVISGGDANETLSKIEDFNSNHSAHYVCDTVEIKIASAYDIHSISDAVPPKLTAYFEIAAEESLGESIATLASFKQRAKLRSGGVTADAFPASKEVLRFVRVCAVLGVPFKATAGLHHPLRCMKPLTYEPDAPVGRMHGFLNLFLAAAFASSGCDLIALEKIMKEDSIEAFEFTDAGISWRGQQFIRTAQISRIREKSINSFGSCSFTEPTDELRELGLL